MKEVKLIAAILTVAFYTGRGSAMNLPQIVATYEETLSLLAERSSRKKKK